MYKNELCGIFTFSAASYARLGLAECKKAWCECTIYLWGIVMKELKYLCKPHNFLPGEFNLAALKNLKENNMLKRCTCIKTGMDLDA